MILQEAYQEYCRRFDDQELAKRDNRHLARIAVALRRFMGLQGIVLSDDPWERRFSRIEKVNTTTQEKSKPDGMPSFSDAALKSRCLTAFRWKGALFTADVECISDNGQMPLWWAAWNGHKAVVKLLLEEGADVECISDNGQMPLWWAAWNGHKAVVKLLREKGVKKLLH
jgi:hypothetical protein